MEYFTAHNPGAQHLLLQQARIKSKDLPVALGVLRKEAPRDAALSAFFAGKMVPALSEGGAGALPALAEAFRGLLSEPAAGFLCAGEELYLFCDAGFSLYQVRQVFGKKRPACLLSGAGELTCRVEPGNLLFVCEGELPESEETAAILAGPLPGSTEALEALTARMAEAAAPVASPRGSGPGPSRLMALYVD